jgi:hypothetical protein
MPASPHDALFKSTFEQPDIARSQLELVLPAAVRAHLDLATLEVHPGSFRDAKLEPTYADLLYAVRTRNGEQAFIYVIFEHQSSFDATMPFRMLRYMVSVWERWQREHEGDDLSAVSAEALAARTLHALGRLIQLALRSSRSRARLRSASPLMVAVAATVVRDDRARGLLVKLYSYLYQAAPPGVSAAEIQSIVLQIAGPEGAEDAMNAAQELIERGRAEGEAKGEARGKAEGLRAAIAAVFSARSVPLSEHGRATIASCSDVATLTKWLALAATAASETEVFVDGSVT